MIVYKWGKTLLTVVEACRLRLQMHMRAHVSDGPQSGESVVNKPID